MMRALIVRWIPRDVRAFFRLLKRVILNFWWKPLLIGISLAAVFSWFFTFSVNLSESLPGHLYLIYKRADSFERGDLIYYRWYGPYYPRKTRFLKVVAGQPGDIVGQIDGDFYVNDDNVGKAKPYTIQGKPLIASSFRGVIPRGKYWVATPHIDSYDSRYEDSGLISEGQIDGKAYLLW